MILTNKCKEQFEIWYLKMIRQKPDIQERYYDENLLSFFWNSDDTIRNARIIEFFDSVDIYVNAIRYHGKWMPMADGTISKKYTTRHEALIRAVKEANEIYNKNIRL